MSTTRMRAMPGRLALVAPLLLVALSPGLSAAAPIVRYATSGQVGPAGPDGLGMVGFNSIVAEHVIGPDYLDLGSFQLGALPSGKSITYVNTPFSITFVPLEVDGGPAGTPPIVLTGVLNGTVAGADFSTVIAAFNPPPQTFLQVGPYRTLLSPISPLLLSPESIRGGATRVLAHFAALPVPEPTALVALGAGLLGLAAHRHRRRGPSAR